MRATNAVLWLALVAGCSSSHPPTPIGGVDATTDDASPPDTAPDVGVDAASDADAPADATDATTADAGDATDADASVDADASDAAGASEDADASDADAADAAQYVSGVPVGAACTSDVACDPSGMGVGACSNHYASTGSLDPQPVCFANRCQAGAATVGQRCGASDAGICIGGGTAGTCVAACTFGNDGSAAVGCVGRDACNAFSFGRSATGAPIATGYCMGGCTRDADCGAGDRCQIESGACVTTPIAYPKTLGQACASSDDCPCALGSISTVGFCLRYCRVGDATGACPSGFVCEPGLPTSDAGGALFTQAPLLAPGSCYPTCASDADCSAIGARCAAASESVTGVRHCVPG